MGIKRKIPYRNHAYRHAAGGSDPLSSPVHWASGTIPTTTVTTPWTMDNTVAAFSSFSSDGSGFFTQDSSSRGIQVNTGCRGLVRTNLTIRGDTGVHTVPAGIRIVIVIFNPGSPPSTAWNGASALLIREGFPPGSVDNNFPLSSFFMSSGGNYVILDEGFSFGVHLEAYGATGNWRYSGAFSIIEQPITFA